MATDLAQRSIDAALRNPQMVAAAQALFENRLHDAEPILKTQLKNNPFNVAAIRMLAELAGRIGRYKDAEALLRRTLEIAPEFGAARANLATTLYKQNRFAEAIEELDLVLAKESENPQHRNLKAAALGRIGGYEEALELYSELTECFPDHAKLAMSHAHLLKTVGKQEESVAAYHRALAIQPGLGEVWWSLANLKTFRFSDNDVAAMSDQLLHPEGLSNEDVFHLHFALGKAYEQRGNAEASFDHYTLGNALRSEDLAHDPDTVSTYVDKLIEAFKPQFLVEREGSGNPAPDVVFILGMPRAGSTLIEQILASHSQIEGTMELPDLPAIALREGREFGGGLPGWIDAVQEMPNEKLTSLGSEYIERTKVQRKTDKPFYIDKLPNNWAYIGLIQLILPNAKIIDARRNPLDCCFSNFKQHYAKGQAFSYNLNHMGRYYADYVRAMAHIDTVMPKRVHRVIHERLIDNPELEIREILNYLGLDFEENCLQFHKNTRAVRTASSEQVRRPINKDGLDQWRDFENYLEPLKVALGNLWQDYPEVSAG